MNSVKNLMIIAVLGAVGYGVYVSLSRNNVDPAQSGVTDGWPGEAKTDLSGATAAKPGGPLALSGNLAAVGRRRQCCRWPDRAPSRSFARKSHRPARPALRPA